MTIYLPKKLSSSTGFTLVELMVTMVIITIIGSFTFAELNSDSYRLKSTANTLKSHMQRARLEAVKRNTNVSINFDHNKDGTLDDDGYLIEDSDLKQIVEVLNNKTTFTTGTSKITFTPKGTCNSASVKLSPAGSSAPEYTITTNNIGRIKSEKTK